MPPTVIMKQREWRMACNRPTMVDRHLHERQPQQLPLKSHCEWSGLCRPHYLLRCRNYWCLSALSVLSRDLSCSRVSSLVQAMMQCWCYLDATIRMLCITVAVSDLPLCKLPWNKRAVQASRQSLMGDYDVTKIEKNRFWANDNRFSRKKNDFNIPT